MNKFLKQPEQYTRNLDVLGTAQQRSAEYLHIRTGKPLEQCLAYVQSATADNGPLPAVPERLDVTRRQLNGDRVVTSITFDELLDITSKSKSILSGNLVVYDHPDVNLSCSADYVVAKKAERGTVKAVQRQAESSGDIKLEMDCANKQTGIKLLMNSLSGAAESGHNPFCNRSAHPALTSMCRIGTNYSNANTERFLAGSRQYQTSETTLSNILTLVGSMDYDKLSVVRDKYNLHVPTVSECTALVSRSSEPYWANPRMTEEIKKTIECLTDLQRMALAYTGDFYHLREMNPEFVRTFMTTMITRPAPTTGDPDDIIATADPDLFALVGILTTDLLAGGSVRDLKLRSYEDYCIYAATIQHLNATIRSYWDLISVLWLGPNTLNSVWSYPATIRRAVVGGDTDSTLFTTQYWVLWYCGKITFTDEANNIAAVCIYLNSQLISNVLAETSKQMGVADQDIYTFRMKAEFSFSVYMRAGRAKHYATLQVACEGNVYAAPRLDIKGVALKDSKLPGRLIDNLQHETFLIMTEITTHGTFSILELQQRIANIEHVIIRSLKSGSIEFLSSIQINERTAYKKPMSSVFMHYELWNAVWGPIHGVVDEPPYGAIKISTSIATPVGMRVWMSTLETGVRERLSEFTAKHGKDKFGTLILPREIVSNGIPADLVSVIDIRKLVGELTSPYYILLEMCGMYFKNKQNTNLLSDDLSYRPELGLPGERPDAERT